MATNDEHTWGMLAHLSAFAGYLIPFGNVIGPFVVWQVKKESNYVVTEAKESLNFQLSVTIYMIVAAVLVFVLIGFLLLPLIGIFDLVMIILAGISAGKGNAYKYPLWIRFIK